VNDDAHKEEELMKRRSIGSGICGSNTITCMVSNQWKTVIT